MKKFILLVISSIILTSAQAEIAIYPKDVILHRHKKGCFLGCNDVTINREMYEDAEGNLFWGVKIQCAEPGFSSCPGIINPNDGTLNPVDAASSNTLMDYALQQIGNNVLSGIHSIQVLNTSTNQLFTYTVEWTVTGEGETYDEEIIISRQLVD